MKRIKQIRQFLSRRQKVITASVLAFIAQMKAILFRIL